MTDRPPFRVDASAGTRPVLVTGAYGLLGGWLTAGLLERGRQVIVIRRDETPLSVIGLTGLESRVTVVPGDITADGLLQRVITEYEIGTVFHLAAQTLVPSANRNPLSTFETNIRGTWLLLEACRLCGGLDAVVVAASDKAYGAHAELPYRETHALTPLHPYDVSKAATDMLARSYWHTYGLPVSVTRLANIYGGGDFNASRLIPETVRALLAGRAPVLRSDGSPERDFLYVADAVSAYLAIAGVLEAGRDGVTTERDESGRGNRAAGTAGESGQSNRAAGTAGEPGQDAAGPRRPAAGEAFNAGGGSPHRVSDVVAILCDLAGGVAPDIRGNGTPDGEIDRQWVDHAKLTALTGWEPRVPLGEGLARTLAWYRRYAPDW